MESEHHYIAHTNSIYCEHCGDVKSLTPHNESDKTRKLLRRFDNAVDYLSITNNIVLSSNDKEVIFLYRLRLIEKLFQLDKIVDKSKLEEFQNDRRFTNSIAIAETIMIISQESYEMNISDIYHENPFELFHSIVKYLQFFKYLDKFAWQTDFVDIKRGIFRITMNTTEKVKELNLSKFIREEVERTKSERFSLALEYLKSKNAMPHNIIGRNDFKSAIDRLRLNDFTISNMNQLFDHSLYHDNMDSYGFIISILMVSQYDVSIEISISSCEEIRFNESIMKFLHSFRDSYSFGFTSLDHSFSKKTIELQPYGSESMNRLIYVFKKGLIISFNSQKGDLDEREMSDKEFDEWIQKNQNRETI